MTDPERVREALAVFEDTIDERDAELTELREELRLVKHNYEALARHVRAGRQLIEEKP